MAHKCLRIETKVYVVRSLLTYPAETKVDTAKIRQILETTEINILRELLIKLGWTKLETRDIDTFISFEKYQIHFQFTKKGDEK